MLVWGEADAVWGQLCEGGGMVELSGEELDGGRPCTGGQAMLQGLGGGKRGGSRVLDCCHLKQALYG